jgi:hypothetical protein
LPGTTLTSATTSREARRTSQYTATTTLNYNRTFAQNHEVNGLLGYEQFYYNTSSFDATKSGLIDFSVTDISSGSEMQSITTPDPDNPKEERDYAMLSYFGRLNYAYKGRYLLEANFRRDASALFAR